MNPKWILFRFQDGVLSTITSLWRVWRYNNNKKNKNSKLYIAPLTQKGSRGAVQYKSTKNNTRVNKLFLKGIRSTTCRKHM